MFNIGGRSRRLFLFFFRFPFCHLAVEGGEVVHMNQTTAADLRTTPNLREIVARLSEESDESRDGMRASPPFSSTDEGTRTDEHGNVRLGDPPPAHVSQMAGNVREPQATEPPAAVLREFSRQFCGLQEQIGNLLLATGTSPKAPSSGTLYDMCESPSETSPLSILCMIKTSFFSSLVPYYEQLVKQLSDLGKTMLVSVILRVIETSVFSLLLSCYERLVE